MFLSHIECILLSLIIVLSFSYVSGMTTSTTFDRLVATSLATESRSGATNSLSGTRKFITSGANPFIGWYELKEVCYAWNFYFFPQIIRDIMFFDYQNIVLILL